MGLVFQNNLKLNSYKPLYDFYDEFLRKIVSQISPDDKKVDIQPIDRSELYSFSQCKTYQQILSTYFNSLKVEHDILTNPQNPLYIHTATNNDFYKIAVKGLLLQLIKISHQTKLQDSLQTYLTEYVKLFK